MTYRYKVAQEVIVNTKDILDKKGTIKFVGKIQNKPDQYIGIELEEPCGKNNGDVNGKQYFKIQKEQEGTYGVFVKANSLRLAKSERLTSTRPSRTPQPPASGRNKLSNELAEHHSSDLQGLKDQLQSAYQRIRSLEELDVVKEVQSLKQKVKEYQELTRSLKLELNQTRYQTDSSQQGQLKELAERLEFFNSQKEAGEREKSELKKKIERLEEELEEGVDRDEMLDKLTIKVEGLEAKNEKLKAELEVANTHLKNVEMLGGTKSNEELQQNITTLNQMISLLESDLNEEKEKSSRLQGQVEQSVSKLSESVRLERKLKSKDEQIETLKIELEAYSDAASFVQKLTLDLITKEETMREQTKRLKQFAQSTTKLQVEQSESQEMINLQFQEIESLEEEIQRGGKEKGEQERHLQMLNGQIAKYKQRIRELSDNNSSLLMNLEDRQDDNVIHSYFTGDVFQHKYYQLCKLHQSTQEEFLQFQLNMASVRHYSGILLSNLYETLPQTFSARLYPNLSNLLLKIAGTNHNLYLLFELCSQALTHRSELYTPEQQNTAGWLLQLLQQIPELYSSLLKIELAITSADSEGDISEIVGHPELKDQVSRIDMFSQELLQRIITETIDIEMAIDPYTEPIDLLDQLSASIQRLPTELATRHQLCIQGMKGVHQILYSVELYRRSSEARETAQVDILLQNFLKLLEGYMRECCTNSHIRLKTEMKSFISGVDLIVKILKEIELNDNLQGLNSLYSDIEDIKMLKQTIMTTQFHLKELEKDLRQISYPTPLSRVHVKLPGRLWQDQLRGMKEQLARFERTLQDKNDLQQTVAEQKKKLLLLQKEIKDRQVTKEVHERRIGELQLKVEQAVFLESDFKRKSEEHSLLEESFKVIEDQLGVQSRRKKELEEQLRRTKVKFDIIQTDIVMKKSLKTSNNLSSDDLSSLAIFKSVLAEAGTVRNHLTKVKVSQLKFATFTAPCEPPGPPLSKRRQLLEQLADCKIGVAAASRNRCEVSWESSPKNGQAQPIVVGRAQIKRTAASSLFIGMVGSTVMSFA